MNTIRVRPTLTLAGLTLLVATSVGCGGDDADVANETLKLNGMTFDLVDVDEAVQATQSLPETTPEESLALLKDKSIDELADDLRPAVLYQGRWYVSREPAYEAARRLKAELTGDSSYPKAGERAGGRAQTTDSTQPSEGPTVETVDEPQHETLPYIFGDDNRWVPNNTSYPHRAVVRLDGPNGDCSGAYIGPRTLLTAAHCIRLNFVTNWPHTFIPGQAGASQPYGSHSNCYFWYVTNGWLQNENSAYDYAIIDFQNCPTSISQTGWFGIWINAPDTALAWSGLFGYPGARCPGAPASATYQCGMYASAYNNGGFVESATMDESAGQSGGPWFSWWNGGAYVTGTHRGARSYFDLFRCGFDLCRRSWGRAIDSTVYQFIVATSLDYN